MKFQKTNIYDKAAYHYGGDFPKELQREQAYVHIGMFLGWACSQNLLSETMELDHNSAIKQFFERNVTGPQLLRIAGGILASDMLSLLGNAFAMDYFRYGHGAYLHDYADVLAKNYFSVYHVKDTWDNYQRLTRRIDQRYREWQEVESKRVSGALVWNGTKIRVG
jgi:hypothetical protein